MPVLLQISKKSVQVHIYKNQARTIGLAYARNSNMSSFTPQIMICSEKGAISEYLLPGNIQASAKINMDAIVPAFEDYFTLDKLPKTVTMNIDCLHSSIDLTNGSYDGQFMFSGGFYDLLGGRRTTVSTSKGSGEFLIKSDNKSLKMECKFDNMTDDKLNRDIVIMGIRLHIYVPEKFGDPESENKLSIKIFNRIYKLKGDRKIHEIGFCEAEILYLYSTLKHKLAIEFISKDPVNYPITIFGVDVFGKRKEELKFDDKLAKLKELCLKEQSKKPEQGTSDIVKEMLHQE
jgi:hypothetical protein